MRFWDSSALIPLLIPEPATTALMAVMREDAAAAVWWTTPVECAAAIARLARDERLSRDDAALATELLATAQRGWSVVPPTDRVQQQAMRLLRLHPLGTADALQLAAALVLAEHDPRTLPFVTLDDRLAFAAEHEGFDVPGPVRARLRRRAMTARVVPLESDEAASARMGGTVDARVAAVASLTQEAWRLAGRPFPTHDRATMPVVVTTLDAQRGSP
jgi:hypothetical protein